jgi:hypothetical protein
MSPFIGNQINMVIILVFLLLQVITGFAAFNETNSHGITIIPEGSDSVDSHIVTIRPESTDSAPAVPAPPTCVICSADIIKVKELSGRLFECEHDGEFHQECLKKWLEIRFNCPLCRANPMVSKKMEHQRSSTGLGRRYPNTIREGGRPAQRQRGFWEVAGPVLEDVFELFLKFLLVIFLLPFSPLYLLFYLLLICCSEAMHDPNRLGI